MKSFNRLFIALFAILLTVPAFAQAKKHVQWSAKLEPADARSGEAARIVVTAQIEDSWHIYSLAATDAGVPTSLELVGGTALKPAGKISQSAPKKVHDDSLKLDYEEFERTAVFSIPVTITAKAGAPQKVTIRAKSQACDAQKCEIPVTDVITVAVKAAPGAARADRKKPLLGLPKQAAGASEPDAPAPGAAAAGAALAGKDSSPPSPTGGAGGEIEEAKKKGLLSFLWLSLAAGFAALLTPCVFPMIPITVSFFTKRKAGPDVSPIAGPLAYCFGIIGTFTGIGILFAVVFGATQIQTFAASPYTNLFLGLLFVVMAANLFGVFEITLPSGLVNSAQAGTRRGGLIGPMLMGLTFSLTSFTCTVPFVGTLLVTASRGGLLYPIVGMLAFSTAFALPFFLLAMFPQYLARMPKSGSWLVSVKATMGFLELAAALKFLSNSDISWGLGLLTRPVFLAIWATIAFVAALYLLGWMRLPHDDAEQKIGIPRRSLGIAMTCGAVYLLAAMNGSNLRALEAFPPPPGYGAGGTKSEIPWAKTYEAALAQAKSEAKPVFINFTGATCVNCREMEANVLPHPDVLKELANFVPVELYTDRPNPIDEKNRNLLVKLANTTANPVYAVVTPEGRLLKALEGRHNTTDFANFLREARTAALQMASR